MSIVPGGWWVRYMPSSPGWALAIVEMSSNAGSTDAAGVAYARAARLSFAAALAGRADPEHAELVALRRAVERDDALFGEDRSAPAR